MIAAFFMAAVVLGVVEGWMPAGQGGGAPAGNEAERLSNTLLLLGATLLIALLLALLGLLVAGLAHSLEKEGGVVGAILGALVRLLGSSLPAMPALVLGIILILLLGVRLQVLPVAGMRSFSGPSGLADVLAHLVLPALTLAILPAVLSARAGYRHITVLREQGSLSPWWAGLLQTLATLLGQIGGIAGMGVIVEVVFAWPGIGLWLYDVTLRKAAPADIVGAIALYAGAILLGRLLAELLRWLARLIDEPLPTKEVRRPANRLWFVLALLLLLAPLGLALAGSFISKEATLQVSFEGRLQPPSAEHPWGMDNLGRDVRARALRGTLLSLEVAALASLAVLIPAGLVGALTGWLASLRTWWSESLADLILLPADVLLFIPPLPMALLMALLVQSLRSTAAGSSGQRDWLWVALILGVVLLPRAVHAAQSLWRTKGWPASVAALFMSGFYAAFIIGAALDFLGFGVRLPLATLAGGIQESFYYIAAEPGLFWPFAALLVTCGLALYAGADALAGLVDGKEALVRLGE